MAQTVKVFENIVGKGENAGNQHFFLFPQGFLSFQKKVLVFWGHFYFFVRKFF